MTQAGLAELALILYAMPSESPPRPAPSKGRLLSVFSRLFKSRPCAWRSSERRQGSAAGAGVSAWAMA